MAIVLLAILLWPRGNYKIAEVESGNTIVLDNGTRVVLIGVSDTDKAKDFLEDNYLMVKVKLQSDSCNPFDPNHLSGKETVYAYVLQKVDGQCVNATIISLGISPLNERYLTDRLKEFRKLAELAR